MPTWPASLPQKPRLSDYTESPPDVLLRTEMDQGPAKVRRRFTAGVRPFVWVNVLTESQLATLDSFFVTDCKHGSLAFTFPHPRTGASITVRFEGPPEYAHEGLNYRVSLRLEQLP